MVRSSWLTAGRVRRLVDVMAALPAKAPGIPSKVAKLRIWRSCGGPIEEVPLLVDVLIGADLAVPEHGHLQLTRGGQRVLSRRGTDRPRGIGLALLRAGYFHDQARTLLELGTNTLDGSLICPSRQARRACPQLFGLLQYWSDVAVGPELVVPADLLRELEAVWALIPPPQPADPFADAIRKTIGNRGELYSYQLERLQVEVASNVVWVARDDDKLGYDIEDRSTNPRRRIEVKASGNTDVRFFLSENEWRKAHENPAQFEIHFWGGVDLGTQPADEFRRLRDGGFPLVFVDLPSLLSNGELEATPAKWRVSRPERSA